MATQSLKKDVPHVSTDNNMNVSSAPRFSTLLQLLQQPDVSLELRSKVPLETANEPRNSQSIRQLERSRGDAADGREMSPDQAPKLPQNTDLDGHLQESSQDVLPRRDLQVHPRVRSSPQADIETVSEFRPARQIFEHGQDRVTAGQKNFLPLCQYGRQRGIPEVPEDHQVRSERSQEEDQETDRDGLHQEYRQDVLLRRDLQVHPRLRSSTQTGLEIAVEFRPELQRHSTSETDYSASETQRVIPEAEENRVKTERSHQAYQKLNRLYNLSMPSGCKDLADERSLKPLDMNVSRPMTPYHFQMPSHDYQLMVSHLAKSRVAGNHSSVYSQDKRNRTDSIKQEILSQENLGQPESCHPTSAADIKLENEQPTPKDSWARGPRSYSSLVDMQSYMEQYLDLWATEPNFVEEVTRIAATLLHKAKRLSAILQFCHRLQQQGVFSR